MRGVVIQKKKKQKQNIVGAYRCSVTPLDQEMSRLYSSRRFISLFTKARHLILCSEERTQSTLWYIHFNINSMYALESQLVSLIKVSLLKLCMQFSSPLYVIKLIVLMFGVGKNYGPHHYTFFSSLLSLLPFSYKSSQFSFLRPPHSFPLLQRSHGEPTRYVVPLSHQKFLTKKKWSPAS
jgi:hypothetical protein